MKRLWGCGWLLAVRLAASDLRQDEQLLLFPTLGHRLDSNQWQLTVHGWVFEMPARPLSNAALMRILGWSGNLSAAEKPLFRERTRYFAVDNERGKTITLSAENREFRGGRSEANGHFVSPFKFSEAPLPNAAGPGDSRWISLKGRAPRGDFREFAGEVLLLGPEGISVLSDIDDTIKVSQVGDVPELLKNTFSRPFRAVPGMARLYQSWSSNDHAQFHYVSASPWQLYPALQDFLRREGFPRGTFHLKTFRWKDQTVFDLFKSPEQHKETEIEPLLRQWPRRRFVLVGDCGEKDPEVYGALARAHPEQVRRIFIRELHGPRAHDDRFAAAFTGIPRDRWRVFLDPAEISEALAR